jgi:hypothetical protein
MVVHQSGSAQSTIKAWRPGPGIHEQPGVWTTTTTVTVRSRIRFATPLGLGLNQVMTEREYYPYEPSIDSLIRDTQTSIRT